MWGPRRGVAAAAALLVVLAACGDPKEQSLCVVYAEYLETEQRVLSVDPTTATAAEMTEVIDDALRSVRHLREVSDGRYADQIGLLDASLEDVRRTLDSLEDDADYPTWQPLVEDSVEDARNAAAEVSSLIGPSCGLVS